MNLPQSKVEEFSNLLEKTELADIIDASTHVVDRISLLKGLELLLFNDYYKDKFKERAHLHKIVEANPWLFGERYALTNSDEGLTSVLVSHLKECKVDPRVLQPIARGDGRKGVVDLVLARRVPQRDTATREHMIIELKRASRQLRLSDLHQTMSYVRPVVENPQFDKASTRWRFWLVGTELHDELKFELRNDRYEGGQYRSLEEGRVQVWVRTWAELLSENEGRLKFFLEQLNVDLSHSDAKGYLERSYPKFIPQLNAQAA